MIIKTIKVSDKGQIAIPIEIRKKTGIIKGDEIILIQKDGKILIQKSKMIYKETKDKFKDILKFSEQSLKRIWDNEEDNIWAAYLKK